jgi:hypothetical protein
VSLGRWDALRPADLASAFQNVQQPWWLAGGWSPDCHLGRVTRDHADIDVQILRRDHAEIRAALSAWDMHAVDPPGRLRPWLRGETLPAGVHDVWCRRSPDEPWAFQLMIADTSGDEWVYRRDERVRRPLRELSGPASTAAMRVLAPEVQLLYKSKDLRPKDEQDFETTLPALDAGPRQWLRNALRVATPGHPWLRRL